jgi:hypothetical protein
LSLTRLYELKKLSLTLNYSLIFSLLLEKNLEAFSKKQILAP